MTEPAEQNPEEVEESDRDNRLLALLLLILLVVIGAGVGTIAFPGVGTDGSESTPTPDVVRLTPTTATPTPTPGSGLPETSTATPATTATPTDSPTPTEKDGVNADVNESDGNSTDTPTPTETRSPTATEDPGDGGGTASVDLTADGSTLLVQTSEMAPGDDGANSITFENSGDATGRLLINDTNVTDDENALLDPERAVGDDATTGELSSALRVRLSVAYSDGTTEYLFGSSNSYVTLQSIDGENRTSTETLRGGEQATVTFEWKLPRSTGNEVQSDSSEFELDFVLRQTS